MKKKRRKIVEHLAAGDSGDDASTKENTKIDVILFIPTHSLMSKDILNGTE